MTTLKHVGSGLALVLAPLLAQAGIANSMHDFSHESWNTTRDLCGPCHMAHGSDVNNQLLPLWGHATTTRTFTPFTSPTVVANSIAIGQPNGSSKACLSCHDGSLAVNQYGGAIQGGSPRMINSDYQVGANGDLSGDHPISFTYDSTLAAQIVPANSLYDPSTRVLGAVVSSGNNLAGQTVQAAMLYPDVNNVPKLQCASCHDVHRQRGDSSFNSDAGSVTGPGHNPLLVIFNLGQDGSGSALCRACHNK
ncbi:MAG TPA: hypothetical protein VFD66_08165 [Verrucomicrobiae bacterium]|nr:hypothetical protein [Verrucomicrobiae bacterium]